MTKFLLASCLVITASPLFAQQKAPAAAVPVHVTVTVEALHGKDVPMVYRQDVAVHQGVNHLRVTDWVACQGEHAGLDLFVLVDDSSSTLLGNFLDDLHKFIDSQPAATQIGVGYTSTHVEFRQALTADHALAGKALRLPLEIVGGSPYQALDDLIKQWPDDGNRRAVLMVTDGFDPLGGWALSDPYLDTAIENAQRAGVVVYSIYFPSVGHAGHSPWLVFEGQNYLARLSEETGGEAYNIAPTAPVSFAPYLAETEERLANQYILTFLATPEKKPAFQAVRVNTEVPNAELVAPSKVYVPAAQAP